jgi:2-C-methyl-D-erythritol 4-phosphate cytidylyltransferase
VAGVCVAVAQGDEVAAKMAVKAPFFIAKCAGLSRADTVSKGLDVLEMRGAALTDWVLVHDAARCLITPEQITTLIEACRLDPVGGLLAHQLADTLKQEGAGRTARRVVSTLDRSDKWLAQTPQMFRIGALRDALHAADQAGAVITDEASAMEFMGQHPLLVCGSAQNFKVTYPEDFALAEAILQSRKR